MSKHLVKILSVCALVVLLMVSVVGAAIGVTEAVMQAGKVKQKKKMKM